MSAKIQTSLPQPGGEISSWQENPLFHVKRLSLAFLRKLFSYAPPGYFHWDSDPILSEIEITGEVPLRPEVPEKRPVIAIARSGAQWNGVTMDQFLSMDLKTGSRTHTDLISGNLTINCLSRVDTEAEQIAWLVSRHFWILRRIFLKMGFTDIGQRISLGSPSPPGSIIQGDTTPEIVNVVALVPFFFQWTESVTEEDLSIFNGLEAEITVNMTDVVKTTNSRIPGGFGTATMQVNGVPVEHQNIMGNIKPPYVKGCRRSPVQQQVGGNKADPPLKVNIKT
jgi:hypothetical protein